MARCCTALVIASLAVLSLLNTSAKDDVLNPKSEGEIQDGEIAVHLKGLLLIGTSQKKGGPIELSAKVIAGGHPVKLDWSQSEAVREELLWWNTPRHGDLRSIQAEVFGKMVFHSEKDARFRFGLAAEPPDPVVIVESLTVRLVGPDGRPRGPQLPSPASKLSP